MSPRFKNENNIKKYTHGVDTKVYYPYCSLAAHIIGFVGTDNRQASSRIEAGFEDLLKGTSGRISRATTQTAPTCCTRNLKTT
jgi:cell division protein FtsI/penicillin-binding protein 2